MQMQPKLQMSSGQIQLFSHRSIFTRPVAAAQDKSGKPNRTWGHPKPAPKMGRQKIARHHKHHVNQMSMAK